jgi:hypothetical protein
LSPIQRQRNFNETGAFSLPIKLLSVLSVEAREQAISLI